MPILKMLSRRKPSSIAHTLSYISREGGDNISIPILHNIRSTPDDHEGVVQEYLANEAYRKITSNRLYCFHTILSLSELDQKQATPEVLTAIANRYLELRGDILAYAVPHFDTDSHHIHVLESATLYRENKSSSLRKEEFHNLKLELEAFVQEQFPELTHSKVEHGKGKAYTKEAEYQLQKRAGTSERQVVKNLVHQAYQNATSKQSFLDALLEQGYIHYERTDGKLTGLMSDSGRKFRFKTLGLHPNKILALESKQERSHEKNLLQQLKNIRQNTNSQNREL